MKKVLSIILTVVMLLGTLSTLSAMPAFAETADSGNAAWDGAGTAEDPYLITNRADLDALSDAVADGERFEGKYFKQTADITLGDTPFLSIGGYVYDAKLDTVGAADATLGETIRAFSGIYDGQGHSIKNGTVVSRYTGNPSAYFSSGFFGAIYNATVMNIVFDGVNFVHKNILNGNVVGVAATALIDSSDAAFANRNVVALCFVKDTCTATVTAPIDNGKLNYTNANSQTAGITYGGIVGRAYSTTIRACKNGADVTIPGGTISAGGIVGNIFMGGSVDRCVNTGDMTLSGKDADVVTAWPGYMDRFFGGIVGAMASNVGIDADILNGQGNALVWECVNDGAFKIKSGSNLKPKEGESGSVIYGGIVGNTYNVKAPSWHYLIRSCYNLRSAAQSSVVESGATINQLRSAGILGFAYAAANTAGSMAVIVQDCYSVDGHTNVYTGTNEIRYHHTSKINTTKDKNGQWTGGSYCATLSGANAVIKTSETEGTKYVHNTAGNSNSTAITTLALDECLFSYTLNSDKTTYTLTRTTTTLAQAAQKIIDTIDVEKYVEATKAAAKVCNHTDEQHTTEGGKPAGSGTKADPYRISSVADLNWIAAGIKPGENNTTYGRYALFGVSESYNGVYFEQVNDIVIDNTPINNIGYYYKNTHIEGDDAKNDATMYMAAFGGNYNGNGYSIKGGQIKSTNPGSGTNQAWASGLFGVIYGATIKNIVIDNVDYNITKGFIAGGIAGISAAPLYGEGAASMDFNVIENCSIINTAFDPDIRYSDNLTSTAALWTDGGVVGGIIGKSIGTTVRNCKIDSTVDITAEFGCVSVGGIAGQVGSTAIINCSNAADIIVTKANQTLSLGGAERGFGGIVGHLLGNSNGTNYRQLRYNFSGLLIENCYFAGTMSDPDNVAANAKVTHWGGILAGLNSPVFTTATTATNKPYHIVNCHNLSAFTNNISRTDGNNVRKGGIVGSGWSNNAYATVNIENCYSVDIGAAAYYGTNEARWQNKSSSAETTYKRPLTLWGDNNIKADGTALAVNADPSGDNATKATKTADAIKVETAKIDAAIKAAQNDGLTLRLVGWQEGNAESTEGAYRFLFGVDSITQHGYVGVEMYAFNANGDRSQPKEDMTTALYDSVLADGEVFAAENLGCSYLSTLVVKNLADGTYSFKPFTTDSMDGERNYGSEIKITITAGKIAVAN